MKFSNSQILLTGGAGFLGSHVLDELRKKGVDANQVFIPKSDTCDLRRWENCVEAVRGRDLVIHLAGHGGGIWYNRRFPGTTFYDNAAMGIQLMQAARIEGVAKFVTIGTVCAYPKYASSPFKESDLWNGYPEETNASYGLSKKILLVQGQAFRQEFGFRSIHLLLANLYGPRDNFDLENSHVVPAMIRKFTEAVDQGLGAITLWGSGKASREFLFVRDAARGILLAAERYDKPEPVNLGSGSEITIRALAGLISKLTGFEGVLRWDTSKPDGQPRRHLSVNKARREFGFVAKTGLREGLTETIKWYRSLR